MDRFVDVTRKFEPRKPANFIQSWEFMDGKFEGSYYIPINAPTLKQGTKVYLTSDPFDNGDIIEMSLYDKDLKRIGNAGQIDTMTDPNLVTCYPIVLDGTKSPVYMYLSWKYANDGTLNHVVLSVNEPIYWKDIYGTEDEVSTQKAINMQMSDIKGIMGGGIRQFLIPGSPLLVSVSPKKGGQHERQIRNNSKQRIYRRLDSGFSRRPLLSGSGSSIPGNLSCGRGNDRCSGLFRRCCASNGILFRINNQLFHLDNRFLKNGHSKLFPRGMDGDLEYLRPYITHRKEAVA